MCLASVIVSVVFAKAVIKYTLATIANALATVATEHSSIVATGFA